MSRNAVYRAMIVVGAGLLCGACDKECPPVTETPTPPTTASAGDAQCDWVTGATGAPKRDLVCVIGTMRVTVDTSGIGEG